MGQLQNACGQNILDKILKQYGNDAIKYLTAQKSKLLLNDKFAQLSRKFHQSFQEFETSITTLAQTKTSQFTKAFQGLKSKANQALPGGIATLQRVKGQSVNQFSGFNKILQQIDQIKKKTLNNLSLQKTQLMGKLQAEKQNIKDQIQKQKPKIPLQDQIPEPLKTTFLKEVQKKFAKQMTQNQEALNKNIMGLFDAAELNRMFQQMGIPQIFQSILGNGFGILQKNIFSNIGGGLSNGGIGNIFNNLIK